jgi:flagellar motor switch protein FliM
LKEVLSQQEIDSLLKAIDSGQIPEEEDVEREDRNKVKPYDFRRPFKLSREYIDTLFMVFENFAKLAGMSISNQLLTNVEMKIIAIEQISFEEFLRSVPISTVVGQFKSEPLLSSQILALSPTLSMQIIEMMCGGASSNIYDEVSKNDFTDLELTVLEEVIAGLLKSFATAWSEISVIETELEEVDSNPQTIQVISPNEPVVLMTFSVEIADNKNFFNICIPYLSFDNIMDKLSLRNRFKYNQSGALEYRAILERHMMNVSVDVEVSLGKSVITVEDILQLESGDIIQLDMNINDPLRMYVENIEYYLVKPGQVDGNLAVEVLEYIEEEGAAQ